MEKWREKILRKVLKVLYFGNKSINIKKIRIIKYRFEKYQPNAGEDFMFTSRKKAETTNAGMISTIIGNNSRIEGVLSASDPARIDGTLRGEIFSESSVIVGEHGVVKGDIHAVEILVAGTVYGNLKAENRIELTETGCVLGDLITKRLVIDEGASFKGNCTMEVAGEKEEEHKALIQEQKPVKEADNQQSKKDDQQSKKDGQQSKKDGQQNKKEGNEDK